MTLQTLLVTLMLVLFATECYAQAERKIPVEVTHGGEDQLGPRIVFAVKEAILASQSFRIETDQTTARMVLRIVTVDSSATTGSVSALATAIIYDSLETPGNGIFISHYALICGSNRIESCAKNILPVLDSGVEFLRKNWPSLWKTL